MPSVVTPLPIGSGGNNPTNIKMNKANTKLTEMMAQGTADAKYDPKVQQTVSESFCSNNRNDTSILLMILGGCLILYGIVR